MEIHPTRRWNKNSHKSSGTFFLPRLYTRLGVRDGGSLEKELKEMREEEDILEKKIREFRRHQSRARLLPAKEGPAKKRRNLESGEEAVLY